MKQMRGKLIKHPDGSTCILVARGKDKEGKEVIFIKFNRLVNKKDSSFRLFRKKSPNNPRYLHHGKVITEIWLRKESAHALYTLLSQVL